LYPKLTKFKEATQTIPPEKGVVNEEVDAGDVCKFKIEMLD
jgi:hypothetical protein